MITNYEIKKVNDNEILYLYFDLDTEFSFNKYKGNIEDKIKKFIKDNKIAFKGTTVALVVGGMVMGNIILNNDIKDNDISYMGNKVSVISSEIPNVELESNIILNIPQNSIVENKQIVEKVTNSQQNENVVIKPVENYVEKKTSTTIDDVQKEEIPQQKEEAKDIPQEKEVDNNTYVTLYRNNGSVVTLELEEYIVGVVGAEMPAAFNIEALKAQAIVARTYALKALSTGKKLTDTSSTQNYKDLDQLRNLWGSSYNTYYNKIKNAVDSTKGMYLTYNGVYIEAVYHSTSNGRTEDSSNVWGNSFPYLISVDSIYDNANPSFIKEVSLTYDEISNKLKMEVTSESEFSILNKTVGDRVAAIEINGKTYKGVDFRNLLGLRSADFDIQKNESSVTFTTRGYGHGVGMSQYGANGMANAGFSYDQILKHYYQGVTINHL